MPTTAWLPNLVPGAGFDSLLGEAKQVGVTGQLELQTGAGGQDGDTSFRILQTSDEFDSELGISAEVQVGLGAFGGSAKFGFKERNKVSAQATFCVIRVYALNAYQRYAGPKLSDEAWKLLENNNKDRFRERFGDYYVSGQRTGVEFYGVIRIEAESVEEQKNIATAIQGSYGAAVRGQGSVSYNENMRSSRHEIEASTFQKGGRVALAVTLDELIAQARSALEQSRTGEGFPFAMELDHYGELALPNDDAHPLDVAAARENVASMATHSQELKRMRNEIDFVLRHQGWFIRPDARTLNDTVSNINKELDELHKRAKICATKFAECTFYSPNYPEVILPERRADNYRSIPKVIGMKNNDASENPMQVLEQAGFKPHFVFLLLPERYKPNGQQFTGVVAVHPNTEGDRAEVGSPLDMFMGMTFAPAFNAFASSHNIRCVKFEQLAPDLQQKVDAGVRLAKERRGIA